MPVGLPVIIKGSSGVLQGSSTRGVVVTGVVAVVAAGVVTVVTAGVAPPATKTQHNACCKIDNKLTFKQHIEQKCHSATTILNMLRRNLYFAPISVKTKKRLWLSRAVCGRRYRLVHAGVFRLSDCGIWSGRCRYTSPRVSA